MEGMRNGKREGGISKLTNVFTFHMYLVLRFLE